MNQDIFVPNDVAKQAQILINTGSIPSIRAGVELLLQNNLAIEGENLKPSTGQLDVRSLLQQGLKSLSSSPHETLGVAIGAKTQDIRKAYRKLALKYHPDKNPKTAALFQVVHSACDLLSDAQLRALEERNAYKQANNARTNANAKGAAKSAASSYNSSNASSDTAGNANNSNSNDANGQYKNYTDYYNSSRSQASKPNAPSRNTNTTNTSYSENSSNQSSNSNPYSNPYSSYNTSGADSFAQNEEEKRKKYYETFLKEQYKKAESDRRAKAFSEQRVREAELEAERRAKEFAAKREADARNKFFQQEEMRRMQREKAQQRMAAVNSGFPGTGADVGIGAKRSNGDVDASTSNTNTNSSASGGGGQTDASSVRVPGSAKYSDNVKNYRKSFNDTSTSGGNTSNDWYTKYRSTNLNAKNEYSTEDAPRQAANGSTYTVNSKGRVSNEQHNINASSSGDGENKRKGVEPPKPHGLKYSAIGSSFIELEWCMPDQRQCIIAVELSWRKRVDDNTVYNPRQLTAIKFGAWESASKLITTNRCRKKNLTPDTQYEFRVRSVEEIVGGMLGHRSDWSDLLSVTLPADDRPTASFANTDKTASQDQPSATTPNVDTEASTSYSINFASGNNKFSKEEVHTDSIGTSKPPAAATAIAAATAAAIATKAANEKKYARHEDINKKKTVEERVASAARHPLERTSSKEAWSFDSMKREAAGDPDATFNEAWSTKKPPKQPTVAKPTANRTTKMYRTANQAGKQVVYEVHDDIDCEVASEVEDDLDLHSVVSKGKSHKLDHDDNSNSAEIHEELDDSASLNNDNEHSASMNNSEKSSFSISGSQPLSYQQSKQQPRQQQQRDKAETSLNKRHKYRQTHSDTASEVSTDEETQASGTKPKASDKTKSAFVPPMNPFDVPSFDDYENDADFEHDGFDMEEEQLMDLYPPLEYQSQSSKSMYRHPVRAEPFSKSKVVGYLVLSRLVLAAADCGDWLKVKTHVLANNKASDKSSRFRSGSVSDGESGGVKSDVWGWCLWREEEQRHVFLRQRSLKDVPSGTDGTGSNEEKQSSGSKGNSTAIPTDKKAPPQQPSSSESATTQNARSRANSPASSEKDSPNNAASTLKSQKSVKKVNKTTTNVGANNSTLPTINKEKSKKNSGSNESTLESNPTPNPNGIAKSIAIPEDDAMNGSHKSTTLPPLNYTLPRKNTMDLRDILNSPLPKADKTRLNPVVTPIQRNESVKLSMSRHFDELHKTGGPFATPPQETKTASNNLSSTSKDDAEMWYEMQDEQGQVYYYNDSTQQSTWEPPEWIEEFDPVSKSKYYIHSKPDQQNNDFTSTWSKPRHYAKVVRASNHD